MTSTRLHIIASPFCNTRHSTKERSSKKNLNGVLTLSHSRNECIPRDSATQRLLCHANVLEFQRARLEFQKARLEFQRASLEFQRPRLEFQRARFEFQRAAT